MIATTLWDRLSGNQPAVGSWMTLTDPAIPVLLGNAGFHWVFIDTEHNPMDEGLVSAAVVAANAHGITPVVRVRENRPDLIKIAFDMGAGGVVVPQLGGVADFRKAVEFAKYPPLGRRGYGPLRATDFWSNKAAYDESANERLLLICQVETCEALESIEEVVSVDGVDAIYIGPADLAHALGHPGNPGHAEVVAAIDRVIAACLRCSCPWGMPVSDEAGLTRALGKGVALPTWGSDNFFIRTATGAARTIIESLTASNTGANDE